MSRNSLSIQINLSQLESAVFENPKTGVRSIVIPIKENDLFESEKGNVYLELSAYPFDNKREGSKDTHLVKQRFSKEKFNAMTEEEKKDTPILGNAVEWVGVEPEPNNSESAQVDKKDPLPY